MKLGVPILGICYGFQVMARALGGKVGKLRVLEYGKTPVNVCSANTLLKNNDGAKILG